MPECLGPVTTFRGPLTWRRLADARCDARRDRVDIYRRRVNLWEASQKRPASKEARRHPACWRHDSTA